MTLCHACGRGMRTERSCFPGWLLLACPNCGRALRLVPKPHGQIDRQIQRKRRKMRRK